MNIGTLFTDSINPLNGTVAGTGVVGVLILDWGWGVLDAED